MLGRCFFFSVYRVIFSPPERTDDNETVSSRRQSGLWFVASVDDFQRVGQYVKRSAHSCDRSDSRTIDNSLTRDDERFTELCHAISPVAPARRAVFSDILRRSTFGPFKLIVAFIMTVRVARFKNVRGTHGARLNRILLQNQLLPFA